MPKSNMFFYEYQVRLDHPSIPDTIYNETVSGIVSTPITDPNKASFLVAAIKADVLKKYSEAEFNNGRLLGVHRI